MAKQKVTTTKTTTTKKITIGSSKTGKKCPTCGKPM